MKQFVGRTRPFEFAITIGTAKRLRSLLGIDLLKPTSERDGIPLVSALFTDIELFVDVLYVLVTAAPGASSLEPEVFAHELPDAWQSARDAFFQEWIDFFRRAALSDKAATVVKQLEVLQAALEETWDHLSKLDVAEMGRQQVRKMDLQTELRKALEQTSSTPGSTLTTSPGLSASSPIR